MGLTCGRRAPSWRAAHRLSGRCLRLPGGRRSGSRGCLPNAVRVPGGPASGSSAGGLRDGEAEGFEFGDELAEPPVVVQPGPVVGELVIGQDAG